MEAFVWDERYLTGEAQVDSEHRELVRLINGLVDVGSGSACQEMIRQTLERLTNYAIFHFEREEALMVAAGCDLRHVHLHKSSHAGFKRKVGEMVAAGADRIDVELLFRFLTHWLGSHVLGFDKTMTRQVALIRSGLSPAEAYQQAHSNLSDDPSSSLLEALSVMHKALTARNDELAKHNRSLEQEVNQRTEALSQANSILLAKQVELQRYHAEISELNTKLAAAEERFAQLEKPALIEQPAADTQGKIT